MLAVWGIEVETLEDFLQECDGFRGVREVGGMGSDVWGAG